MKSLPILFVLALVINAPSLACKMTEEGADARASSEITDRIQSDTRFTWCSEKSRAKENGIWKVKMSGLGCADRAYSISWDASCHAIVKVTGQK